MQHRNSEVYYYDKWSDVLEVLELTAYEVATNKEYESSIRECSFSKHGSEGEKHKA